MTTGERVIAFIERYCRVPEGALVGQPIQLADFQKRFILEIYDNPAGTRRAYLSIARKNGKTALIACLLLAHLVGPVSEPNSQIVSGARSREQAGLVFQLAQKIINLSETLRGIVRIVPSGKRLIGLPRNVEYRALSAESSTAHGLSPVLALLDEVGQVRGPQDDFIDAITTSQGAHEKPLLIAISTQSPNDADLFSQWLDDARASNDGRIVSHVYAAEKDADLTDRAAWEAANPALGVYRSLDDLQEQASQAERMPASENTFRNLCLNQRVAAVSPFVARNVWESCAGEVAPLDPALPVWGGLDLSARTDLTALVLIQRVDDIWQVHPFVWAPKAGLYERSKRDRVPYEMWERQGFLSATPGATVDYGHVAAEMGGLLSEFEQINIAYDRWRIDLLKRELDAMGLFIPLEPYGQGYKDMSPALDMLESELLNRRLIHSSHPVLNMCAANAVVTRDPANNRKLDKAKANGRIDAMQALAMAFGAVIKEEDAEESPWEDDNYRISAV